MRSVTFLKLALATSVGLSLAACNTPRGASQARSILRGAEEEGSPYAVVPVSRDSVGSIAHWPKINGGVHTAGWLSRTRGPGSSVIQPGDTVDVTIWETSDVTLLSEQGKKMVALPKLTVSPDGTVFLPFADKVYIANMTSDEARNAIQQRLDGVIPSAQVLLAYEPGRKQMVDLVSGVPKPGSFALPDRDFTVLGLLALGGGVPESMENPYIRLIRGGKLYGVSMDALLKDPSLDTTLRGGDKVYVESDERYFIALGASGKESQYPFPRDRVSALEALSISGGLLDSRANAKGVLILRDYRADDVRADGSGPPKEKVIFAIDLTTADGLFSAGEFTIQNRDVIVVTESAIGSTASVLGLIASMAGLVNTAQDIGAN